LVGISFSFLFFSFLQDMKKRENIVDGEEFLSFHFQKVFSNTHNHFSFLEEIQSAILLFNCL